MSKFQIIFLSIFVIFIVAGVTAFALFKGSNAQATLPAITVWGTLPADSFNQFVTEVNSSSSQQFDINYVQKDESSFNQDFIEALANGSGPDAILIPQDMILQNEDKITIIPYTAFPERTFLDTYVGEASLYLRTDGITAIPFSIDPMVMYWNRDTFTNAGVASAGTISDPLRWSDFPALVAKMTQKDNNSNITSSFVALGQFSNLDHAREILGTLLLQAGNPVTARNSMTNSVSSALGDATQDSDDAASALSFFVRFTDPTDPAYSWNRSLPDSQSFFLSGKLATYFGFASEFNTIRSQNPNLNFDVAPMPQPNTGEVRTAYGRIYGFSLVKGSPRTAAAYSILSNLTTPAALATWMNISYLPPIRRDMIAQGTTDPYLSIFYDAALISKDWLDPDEANTAQIFQNMVESVTSGSSDINDSIKTATQALDLSIKNI